MSEFFDVQWAEAAEGDLRGIVDFITEDSLESALEVLDKLRAGSAKLERFPLRGRVVPELLKHGLSRYHELVIRPWRIIYRTDETTVYVLAVVDGRRNVEDVLLLRLIRP